MISPSHFHPMVVHFPIALITVGFLSDLFTVFYKKEPCLSKMGYWLEVLGTAGAIVAYGTGYFLTSPMEGEAGLVRDRHQLFAGLSLAMIIIATIGRMVMLYQGTENTRMKFIPLGFYFLAFIFILITGYLGGSLVIDYMIGL
jgi:uncharacterized membrane protein